MNALKNLFSCIDIPLIASALASKKPSPIKSPISPLLHVCATFVKGKKTTKKEESKQLQVIK